MKKWGNMINQTKTFVTLMGMCLLSALAFPSRVTGSQVAATFQISNDPPVYLPLVLRPPDTAGSVSPNFFKVGIGYADVITRQLVRTASDKVYMFCLSSTTSTAILTYWTDTPGVPVNGSSFTGHAQFNVAAQPISVDAVYDGNSVVHVLINLTNGSLYDYPFDLDTNSYKPAKLLASGNPVRTQLALGTAGVSGMFGEDGTLNIAYWSRGDTHSGEHISYVSYTYDKATNVLKVKDGPMQLDAAGETSNHPKLVVSPLNGNLIVAWVNQLSSPPHIMARIRTASGWSAEQMASTPATPVWIQDAGFGLNVDQGPSMVVTSDGKVHLAYAEDHYSGDATGSPSSSVDYGRAHYVTYTPQTGWVDTKVYSVINGVHYFYLTHDPSLTTDTNNQIYLFGHGMYDDPAPCTSSTINCYLKLNGDGTWTAPQPVVDAAGNANPPSNETFDDSVSMKWSVVGWNRPELVEFAFFSGNTSNYWNMNLYYGTLGLSAVTPTSMNLGSQTACTPRRR